MTRRTYPYGTRNRFDSPCSYMYPPYGKEPFLDAFEESRSVFGSRLRAAPAEPIPSESRWYHLLARVFDRIGGPLDPEGSFPIRRWRSFLADACERFPVEPVSGADLEAGFRAAVRDDEPVETSPLLFGLIFSLAVGPREGGTRGIWLDRLAGRWEVTKKIHAWYLAGFRKGSGRDDDPRLYALTALAFALDGCDGLDLRIFNALLKLIDRLCSEIDSVLCDPTASIAAGLAAQLEHRWYLELKGEHGLA